MAAETGAGPAGRADAPDGGGADTVDTVDVIVVGLGPGGEELAGRVADGGLSVVGVERHLVGGECPYYGCVPTKMMIRAGNLLAEARRVDGMAGSASVTPDWAPVARRIRDEATDDWDDAVAVRRLEGKGVTVVRGSARLDGPGRVVVAGRAWRARRGVVLATGTVPAVPPVPGLDDVPFWTNREAVRAESVPASLVVLGGGAVGVELAQVFARFGARVTVLDTADRLVAVEEPAASEVVRDALAADGVDVRVGVSVERVRRSGDGVTLTLADPADELTAERLLVTTGRRVELDRLGVETVGLDPGAARLEVDGRMRAADGLWALGDVTADGGFTHVAVQQARIAADDVLGRPGPEADARGRSWVTFTDPEIGRVGMTEAQAREAGRQVRVGTSQVASSARGWIHGPGNAGFVTLVEDAAEGVLVGATAVGPAGGEVLGLLALAVHARVPVPTLRTMTYAYPTFHRGVLDALEALA